VILTAWSGRLESTDDEERAMSERSTIRALVAYESMFGNTERVAHAVAAGLGLEDVGTTVLDVSGSSSVDVREIDLLVVGAPTHAFSLSRPSTRKDAVSQGGRQTAEMTGMREWISRLPSQGWHAPLVAAFDTRVSKVHYLPACASRRAAHLLGQHGCRMVVRPAGFLVRDVPGPLESREVDRAIAWGRQVAVAAQNLLAVSHV
jgi:flavodoxin